MTLIECCQAPVVSVPPETPVYDVAGIMAEQNVGSVVVVEGKKPVGIVTDRDITVRVTAAGRDPKGIPVRAVMTADLLALPDSTGLYEALEAIRKKGVRRVPVTDEGGSLVGIITVDDVIRLLAVEMERIAAVIKSGSPNI
ncbi:CBS domain-containing protein [Methanofollis tationis]|uniref:CBS domain-containing protein n=1 Tax=Methanofollis tationis TaxID=81417 RepID=A0A7K4HR55_9EURY|nr:CBS domain-containing protein [Methanofollis tationis]NVO67360.1 CBS domain-containing protein [Methanofollis tationis]